MTDERLLPIGRFARLCRLSVKQLRHYDDLGLLRPAAVDPLTGYRSYAPEQARDALTVALLRTLEVPLPTIRDLLGGDHATVTRLLATERDRMEGELERRRGALRTIRRLLDQGLGGPPVTLASEPDRHLLVARATCGAAEIAAATGGCVRQLLAAAESADLAWNPPIIGLFPLDMEEPLAIAVGVETGGDADAPGLDAARLPGGPTAVTTHVGPYAELPPTYHALLAWVYEHGHTPTGPIQEVYLTDPNTTDPAQLVTRLVVGIDRADLEEPS